jgi:anthranilate phosphoribosyltransferase
MEPREAISRLLTDLPLSAAETENLFERMLSGMADAAQWGAILALMQRRGPVVDEIVGAARAMRRVVERVPIEQGASGAVVIDTCGTGGAAKTFNISTTSAIVVASAAPGRVMVAKHGNRSRTGRGSAEVLRALGVNVDATPAVQARCLEGAGVCFCFAIHHHPAMKHAAGPRASLGVPTIFNLLGPLTNPAGASHQLIGVYDAGLIDRVAGALATLGSRRALVVHSEDGMDEISPCGATRAAFVEEGRVADETITPEGAGLTRGTLEEIRAASLDDSVRLLRSVLRGEAGTPRTAVLLNAGAALRVAGVAETIGVGARMAAEAIDSGAARATLDSLVEWSNRA